MQSALALTPNNYAAVSCQNVTKTYGGGETEVAALRGVDLEVVSGEFFMIVGPSGCGKTTLISVITAILAHDSGQCHVLGRDLHGMNESERARFRRKTIGLVFQSFNLLPAVTAVENVAVPLLVAGVAWESALVRAKQLLQEVGLSGHSDALPTTLSGGQQQRVAIARALANDPALIVCDEPTSNLDHEAGQSIMQVLRNLGNSDRTIIVVTHDPRIFGFADRIARMDDGRIVEIVERALPEQQR